MEKWIEFLDARDQLFGFGNYMGYQNVENGLKRLRKCDNDEAVWCCKILDEGVTERSRAFDLFNNLLENDFSSAIEKEWAFIYTGLIGHSYMSDYINQAAILGNSLALAMQANWSMEGDQKRFEKARRSADMNDRMGLYQLSLWYYKGVGDNNVLSLSRGFEDNNVLSLSLLRRSADLGYAMAMQAYGTKAFTDYDLERYLWYERAAQRTYTEHFFQKISALTKRMATSDLSADELEKLVPVIFTIGQIFYRNSNPLIPRPFGMYYSPLGSLEAMKLYETFSEMARNATYAWLIVAKRVTPFLYVVFPFKCRVSGAKRNTFLSGCFTLRCLTSGRYKDVAQLIARYIWNRRINWNSQLALDFF